MLVSERSLLKIKLHRQIQPKISYSMVQKTQVPKQAKNKTKAAAKEEDAKAKLVKQAV